MHSRRVFLLRASLAAGSLALASPLAMARVFAADGKVPAPPAPTIQTFKIRWKDDEIGTHVTSIVPSADRLGAVVTTKIRMEVGIGFITAFRYEHDSAEEWRNGRLLRLTSKTYDDGDHHALQGEATAEGFRATGSAGSFVAPADILTTNCLWLPSMVKEASLIDSQNAVLVGISSAPLGQEHVTVQGKDRVAERHSILTPFIAGSLWYDKTGTWVRSRFEIKGETLEYNLVA